MPEQLGGLSDSEAAELCRRLRVRLIDTVSRTGGHLASSLGAVELIVAIHRVFDTGRDRLVFDVGHQCYAHKILTGRNAAMELDGRVDAVSVSLNASTPEKYDALCHSQFGLDALPAIMKFTANAVFNVPHVRMTVVSTMPKEEIDACKALCDKIGADFFVREYIDK